MFLTKRRYLTTKQHDVTFREHSNIHTYNRENLKSHVGKIAYLFGTSTERA